MGAVRGPHLAGDTGSTRGTKATTQECKPVNIKAKDV